MHHTIDNTDLNNNDILSSYFYTDADDILTYLILKLVFAISNYKNNMKIGKEIDLLFFTYTNNGKPTLLND